MKERLDAGDSLQLVDVRTAANFNGETGHIEGALNLPLEELSGRMNELEGENARPLLMICTTDRRSAKAARQLAVAGFTDIHVVEGGMSAWTECGWPVERNI